MVSWEWRRQRGRRGRSSWTFLSKLFEQHFHSPVEQVQPLQGQLGGSGRKIIRLRGANTSAIGILYDVREENAAFLEFSRHFRKHGLPVPEIYAQDLDQEPISKRIWATRRSSNFLRSIARAIRLLRRWSKPIAKSSPRLPRFQIEAGRDLNYKVCYPRGSFDRQSISWDLNYFKYYFLRLAGIPFNEQALEDDFSRLTKFLLERAPRLLSCIAISSREISCCATASPFSLTIRAGARARCSTTSPRFCMTPRPICRRSCASSCSIITCDTLAGFIDLERDAFMHHYYAYVYVRIMQALGAYGFRGFYERKVHFLQSVPYALKNLRWLLHNVTLPIALPTLTAAFHSMLASEKLQGLAADADNLVVRIFSFSFHRGLPKDESGNGGGFIFDGRSLPNPGREERFKTLTGRDQPVIDYLNQQESVHQYLASVMSLVDSSVNNYQRRGFKNLMVSFGCTGGQHRSVYLAEQVAKRLQGRGGVEVVLRHRELEKIESKNEPEKPAPERAKRGRAGR